MDGEHAGDHPHRGGLAGPVAADEPCQQTGWHGDVDPIDGNDVAEGPSEVDRLEGQRLRTAAVSLACSIARAGGPTFFTLRSPISPRIAASRR